MSATQNAPPKRKRTPGTRVSPEDLISRAAPVTTTYKQQKSSKSSTPKPTVEQPTTPKSQTKELDFNKLPKGPASARSSPVKKTSEKPQPPKKLKPRRHFRVQQSERVTRSASNHSTPAPKTSSSSTSHTARSTPNGFTRSSRRRGVFVVSEKERARLPREVQSLTEWGTWMYDIADKSAARLREEKQTSYEAVLLEEERQREEKRLIALEKSRIKAEEERLRKIKEAEEEKKRRKEQELIKKEERRKREEEKARRKKLREEEMAKKKKLHRRRYRIKEESDSPEPVEEEEADEEQGIEAEKEEPEFVDGYVPFMAHMRSDVEIPIRDGFFVEEVIKSTTEQITELAFNSAAEIIKETAEEDSRKYKQYRGLEAHSIPVATPVFANVKENYYLLESQDLYLDPLEEIGRLMEMVSVTYIPEEHKLKLYNPQAPYQSMVGRYSQAFFDKRYDDVIKIIYEFNDFMSALHRSGEIIKHIQHKKTFSRLCLHELLNQIYSRAVSPKVRSLKSYKAFSNEVYGELLPKFISKVFDHCGVNSSHRFIDLGSGVGNVTIQAALEYGCESYGVEIMKNCSVLAEKQEAVFAERCRLFGIQPGKVKLFHNQSFVGNQPVLDVINKCDIILVNNFLFTPELNKQTLQLFLDLNVGTRIISLKKVIPEARYHDFDDDFLSKFLVEKHEFGSGCVSWTDAGGVYYITTFTGQVSEERKQQLRKLHNTRRKENEFLMRSASVTLSSSSSGSASPPSSDPSYKTDSVKSESTTPTVPEAETPENADAESATTASSNTSDNADTDTTATTTGESQDAEEMFYDSMTVMSKGDILKKEEERKIDVKKTESQGKS